MERKDAAMSDTQQGEWIKPAAMAIPKGGVHKDKAQQGRYGPIFPDASMLWLFDPRKNHPRSGGCVLRVCQKHREDGGGSARLSSRAQAALPPLDSLSDQRGDLLYVSGHLRHRLRQVYRGCCGSLRS